MERYLSTIGFIVDNSLFAKEAKFFRNALVRSNYANYSKGVDVDFKYLNMFYENLLFEGKNILKSRDVIVSNLFAKKDKEK